MLLGSLSQVLFLTNQVLFNLKRTLSFVPINDFCKMKIADVNRRGPLVEYERRISDGELMTGDICQVRNK